MRVRNILKKWRNRKRRLPRLVPFADEKPAILTHIIGQTPIRSNRPNLARLRVFGRAMIGKGTEILAEGGGTLCKTVQSCYGCHQRKED
jgi:hypothetical protein